MHRYVYKYKYIYVYIYVYIYRKRERENQVFDQYLDCISLGHNLFHLNQPDSYIALNDPEVNLPF